MSNTLTPQQFVAKWRQISQKEIAASQSHFFDICRLVNHPSPTDYDPTGKIFAFETTVEKPDGSKGRADVFYQDHFIWEYKKPKVDLSKAYNQLQFYRDALGNPPLLITSDMQRSFIHTNFTGRVKRVYEIDFDSILEGDGVPLLKRAFYNPYSLEPDQTQEAVTRNTAKTFLRIAEDLRKWAATEGRAIDSERLAHFIVRLLFCLFAEDMKLLPEHLFTKLIEQRYTNFNHFVGALRDLFEKMRAGGQYGFYRIPYFNGGLFDDDFVPQDLPTSIQADLMNACKLDWSSVDPSIFGTLFEQVIDPSKRAQLGAHYTSQEDIMLIVEPVLVKPLRDKWATLRRQANSLVKAGRTKEAHEALSIFSAEIAEVKVLDPACGSGNFLYIALRELLGLQKEVITWAKASDLEAIPLTVSPTRLSGIEINPYAHELAQVTVWIGYIQWLRDNGFETPTEPILQPLRNIKQMDAILIYDDGGQPVEPEWPAADVVIGNPPFLGSQRMRGELGSKYVDDLRHLYSDRLPGQSDLCCYWFEKARALIALEKLQRAGLLATQGIRGGANKTVLERIKQTGDIFWGESDRNWILEGATVHVSMIGFDNGSEQDRILDGVRKENIHADLTAGADLTKAKRLPENSGIAYQGPVKVGSFDIDQPTAKRLLAASNPTSRPNTDVIRPWVNGLDITGRPRNMYIIDFGDLSLEEAALYEGPFEYIRQIVKPERDKNNRARRRAYWWQHGETVPTLRRKLSSLSKYIITPRVSKHRLFIWMNGNVLPDSATVAITLDSDCLFGILHSKVHELWARSQGTQLREAESGARYTPSSTFETFPFPWPPGQEPSEDERVRQIAQAARDLNNFREAWLTPEGVGVMISEKMVSKRTLTNLYNALTHYQENAKGRHHNQEKWKEDVAGIITLDDIEELDYIHNQLDCAVLNAYGWPHHLSDEEILERLLALNLERAKS